jgi:hypothetical protein
MNPYLIASAACFAPIVLWTTFLAYSALKPSWKSLRLEVKLP